MKKNLPVASLIVAAIFLLPSMLIGLYAIYYSSARIYQALNSASWPTSQGVVTQSTIDSRQNEDGNTYHARLRYEFQANGATFTGHRISFGDFGTSNSSHADRIVRKYPTGTTVTVHYNPVNPRICVLEPGIRTWNFLLFGIGVLFFLFGFVFLKFVVAYLKKSPAETKQEKVTPNWDNIRAITFGGLPEYLDGLLESRNDNAFLALFRENSDDILQFRVSRGMLAMVFAIGSPREKSLEERFKLLASELRLCVTEIPPRGKGARLLETTFSGGGKTAAPIVEKMYNRLFDVRENAVMKVELNYRLKTDPGKRGRC